ncbi:MAG TPA: N-acetyl-gamma-glutamyl-phosphate reductase [Actinomycetota bacterium]
MGSLRTAVLGASGYTGAELLRLAAAHPHLEVVAAGAAGSAGRAVGTVYPHLAPFAGMTFESLTAAEVAGRAEAALLALPHQESAEVAPALVEAGLRVVDLSGAFRLPAAAYPEWYGFAHPAPAWLEKAVYGLSELAADQLPGAALVANPGCYATAALLPLVPLVKAGLVEGSGVVIDAKSGISGAGKVPTESTHFGTADGSIRPYGAGTHRHTPEIEGTLGVLGGVPASITFVPHLVPTVRGIVATCYAPAAGGATATALLAVLTEAYAASPFVRVLPEGSLPDSKRLQGSNAVELAATIDARTGTAILVAALDNLVKGAAGQAIQNLNLMHGFPETAGLEALAVYP